MNKEYTSTMEAIDAIDIMSEEEENDGEEFEHYRAFKRSLSESPECSQTSNDCHTPPLSRQLSESSIGVLRAFDRNSTFNNKASMDGLGVIRIEKCPMSIPLDTEDSTARNPGLIPSFEHQYSSQTMRFWERYNKFFLQGKSSHKLPRPYICSVCHKKFHWLSSLIQHKLLHKGKRRSCGHSHKSCPSIGRLGKQR